MCVEGCIYDGSQKMCPSHRILDDLFLMSSVFKEMMSFQIHKSGSGLHVENEFSKPQISHSEFLIKPCTHEFPEEAK